MNRYEGLVDMIGDTANPTPLVRLSRVVPEGPAELLAKLEWMNPFGSVKDRAAKWMLKALENRGELSGKTVLEATSGNTGIALAAISRLMGYPFVATVPHNMPVEKEVLLRALGAELVHTSPEAAGDRHPMDVALDLAKAMLEESDDYVMPNQYDNPDNALAHYESTGPEIWAQTEGQVRYFLAGVGTGGTVSGTGRYLKERNPDVRVVAIEPVPGHRISGLKNMVETTVPGNLDGSVIDEVVYVNDERTQEVARLLHAEEALFVGSSGAAAVAGALEYLTGRKGMAVVILPDSSQKAVSFLRTILGY